jgi:hypothetical protein
MDSMLPPFVLCGEIATNFAPDLREIRGFGFAALFLCRSSSEPRTQEQTDQGGRLERESMDPRSLEEEETTDHEMVPMRLDSAEFGSDGGDGAGVGSSSPASMTASALTSSSGRASSIEFNNVNVFVPPSFFQGCCGGPKGVPKHILKDISGRLQVRHFPFCSPLWPPASFILTLSENHFY